jgi:hypothetical protein
MAVTLGDLRTSAKIFANMQDSDFLDPTEWALLINKAYRFLYARVTAKDPQFRVTYTTPVTLTPTANSIAFPVGPSPAAFKELVVVEKDPLTQQRRRLNPVGIRDSDSDDIGYKVEGQAVTIEPPWRCNGSFRIGYVPQVADLADPNGTMDVELEQFREFVELKAAIYALATDEQDIVPLASLLAVELGTVDEWAQRRRKVDSDTVEDVRPRNRGWWDP